MKPILKYGGIALAILIVILIALPFLINVNNFRPQIEAQLTNALGRQVGVGNLSLSLLAGNVVADNITIADDPAFSKSPFITAKSLKVGVEMMPLIFSKQLHVTQLILDQPEITLLKTADNKWNFSSLGGKSAPDAKKTSSGSTPDLSVGKLEVNDGRLIVGKANSSAKPQIYDKFNIDVDNFSFASQFPYKLTTNLPGGGDASFSGKAGPIGADAAKTPFDATVKVNSLNIDAAGFVDPASGIDGLADFDGTLTSNGSQAKAVGTFTGSKMKFSPKGTPASQKLVIKHSVDLDLDKQSGTISQGDILVGKAAAHLTGAFQTQGESQVLNMKLNAPDLPVDELEAFLPALGITLPSGSQLKGGTLSANLGIVGPVDKLVITGPVKLSNSKLANFNLGSKLSALSAFTGKTGSGSSDTTIQNASMNARLAPEGTQATNINLTVPAIGVITGGGMVSPAGALNFKMQANLQGGMAGGLTQMAGLNGKSGIPFTISGTTSNPQFVPDMKGVATGVAQGVMGQFLGGKKGATGTGQTSPVDALGGLFGKKKK